MDLRFNMYRIVYMVARPFNNQDYDRFGIKTLIDKGWLIEIWDITPITNPIVWEMHTKSNSIFMGYEKYIPILSIRMLINKYRVFKSTKYIIDQTGSSFFSIIINIIFKLSGAIRIVCELGSIPHSVKINPLDVFYLKILKSFKIGPIESIKLITKRIIIQLGNNLNKNLIKPGYIVVSGTKSINNNNNNKLIIAHSLDYDIYLKIKNFNILPKRNYAVFLDIDCCFHIDNFYSNTKPPSSPAKYFPAITNALRTIAKCLGLEMFVAAHPRSTYHKSSQDYFDGIPIFYGSTAEMIRDCSVVISHATTALQFAVLFGKPVIFITTDELNASHCGSAINCFATEFGKLVINIDNDLVNIDWKRELSVDAKKYSDYRTKYIKIDGSLEKPVWEIVSDRLELR